MDGTRIAEGLQKIDTRFGPVDCLFIIVIDLDPVAIGVFEVELFYTIHAGGDGIFFTGPVFVFHAVLFKVGYIVVDGKNAEAKMGVLIVRGFCLSAGNNMQVAMDADAEPGMAAIVERFGNGIEPYHLLVELGAGFEINYIAGDVVQVGFILGHG